MTINTILEFDADPLEDILREADEAKLLELKRIFLQFQKYEKALLVQKELDRRAQN